MKKVITSLMVLGTLSVSAQSMNLKRSLKCEVVFSEAGKVIETVNIKDALQKDEFFQNFTLDKKIVSADGRFEIDSRATFDPKYKSESVSTWVKDNVKDLSYSISPGTPSNFSQFQFSDGANNTGPNDVSTGFKGKCSILADFE